MVYPQESLMHADLQDWDEDDARIARMLQRFRGGGENKILAARRKSRTCWKAWPGCS